MPAAASQNSSNVATKQEFDSVKSILVELNVIYHQQSEIRETLDAKGVPAASVNMLASLHKSGSVKEYEELCVTAVKVATDKYGGSAVKIIELQDGILKLSELDEDAHFVRRIAKGMGFSPQAISMLTNIIRQNPGDGGTRVLTDLMGYAAEYGIKLEGVRVVEGGTPEPSSVLPNIVLPEENRQGLMAYKDILLELCVAVVVTYTALSLLT